MGEASQAGRTGGRKLPRPPPREAAAAAISGHTLPDEEPWLGAEEPPLPAPSFGHGWRPWRSGAGLADGVADGVVVCALGVAP
jgi:hypothetical protein